MADDLFRNLDDFASSDMIYSMREQMTPSDEVVRSLLAKISACDASPEGLDNISNFDFGNLQELAQELAPETKTRRSYRSLSRKSLMGLTSAAAACVIMLTSAFAVMGSASPASVGKFIDKITPKNVVTTPIQDSEKSDPDQPGDSTGDADVAGDAKDTENTLASDEPAASDEATKENASAENKTDTSSIDQNQSQDQNGATPSNGGESSAPAPAPETSSANTVDKTGEGDATFSREILAEESVSHLTISGSNYVVDTSAATPVTTSEIKSISLEIPETSTTNSTVVKAHVKKIKNVSANLMVALDVNGFKDTLLYTNESYSPNTLGDFISDSGLDQEVSFSKYVYCKGDNIGYSSYHKFTVPDLSEYAENYLFMNESAPLSSHILYEVADTHVTFKSKSNPTCSSIDFGVSDNGYLYVKMAGGKTFTFYVGTDSTASFISSITGE